jgi:bifunctional non-homologous end joining protein LigD
MVEDFDTDGQKVYRAALENGLEGVVAKQKDSIYELGKRSKNWLKIKAVNSDEFVIGGFTQGTGNRSKTFGALVLGYYDKENKLQPAGDVGTGFDSAMLMSLRKQLDSIVIKRSPFKTEPDDINGVTWVKPEMVVEVKFAEWTQDKRLRAPVFLRVRDDKAASAVHPTKVVEKSQADSFMTATEKDGSKAALVQMGNKDGDFILEIEGQKVSLTNLDKAIWPATKVMRGFTKRDLITYLIKAAPYLLPHLTNRPLSLSRFPNGIYGEHFFQKHYKPLPGYVETVVLSAHDLPDQEYLTCNNLATLLWLGQIADIELHSWFSRVVSGDDFKVKTKGKKDPDYYANFPDFLIFDIDPYIYSGKEAAGEEPELNRTAFNKTCRVALKLKETLDTLKCPAFVKTSGKTGLHVFIPVLRQLDFHGVHATAETLCKYLQQKYPDEITIDWAVEKRAGKIFLDYNQNVRGKTLASIYSPRPSPQASVSVPLKWEELGKVYPTDFTILNVPDRLAKVGDIWATIMNSKIDIVKQFSGMVKES